MPRELNFLHHFLARVAPKELRRLTEGAQESFTHPSAIDKTGLPRDDINRVMALLDHQPCGFKTELLHSLGGRLSCFSLKGATELARAQVRHLGQFVDRQGGTKIFLSIGVRVLSVV